MSALLKEDVNSIGAIAGHIWSYLHDRGSVSLTQLAKEVDAPRDTVMQGVGWLAREGKVVISKDKKTRQIRLA